MEITKEYRNCLRCGRKLKSEESKKLGFGKICWEKHNSESSKFKELFPLITGDKDAN